MDWRPIIDGLVLDCLCPLNGLTRIVYMTEGHLLNAPPLMLKCYRINWRPWKSCKIDYPPFPQRESDLKPASVPNSTLGQALSYLDHSEGEQKGTPLMLQMLRWRPPEPSDGHAWTAFNECGNIYTQLQVHAARHKCPQTAVGGLEEGLTER